MTTLAQTYDGPDMAGADEDNIDDLLPSLDTAAPQPPASEIAHVKAAKAPAGGVDRTVVRRAAAKTEELLNAPDDQRRVLAHLLGSGPATVDLVVAVLTAPRLATRTATDLFEVADSDPMEAGVNVAALPKDRSKALWALLTVLGEVAGTQPASDAKAAIAIAKAALKLPPVTIDLLHQAVALGKRS